MVYTHIFYILVYVYVFCCPVESSTIIVVLFPFLFAVIFLLCMYILCYVVHKISLKHLIFLCWSLLSNVLYISIHLFCLKLKLKFEWILYRKIFRDFFMQFVLHDTIFECHTCSLPHRYLLKRELRPYCFLMYFSVSCFFGICNNNDIGYKIRTHRIQLVPFKFISPKRVWILREEEPHLLCA